MLNKRQDAIKRLQELRGSKVLVYFLSDRRSSVPLPGIHTSLAGEPQMLIYDHLRKLGRVKQLDVFLHTRGGNVDAVWPLVQLCRSMTDKFCVIVPLRAHSAGTLLCLGADEVTLGTAAELSPIDPTTMNPFNPTDSKGRPKPISVEDVTSYFRLARDEGKGVGLTTDDHILKVFEKLSSEVHPLALGNVNRAHTQIRFIGDKLLRLHLTRKEDEELIERAVKALVEELYSHTHIINRDEAISILGDNIIRIPPAEVEEAMWNLFECYADLFELRKTFNIKEWMGNDPEKEFEVFGAALESEGLSHIFKAKSIIRLQPDLPPQVQIQIPLGQRLPPMPGFPTKVSIEPYSEGWYINQEEV